MKKYSFLEVVTADVDGFDGIREIGKLLLTVTICSFLFFSLTNYIYQKTSGSDLLGQGEFVFAWVCSILFSLNVPYQKKAKLLKNHNG